jgi:hypothetical protein
MFELRRAKLTKIKRVGIDTLNGASLVDFLSSIVLTEGLRDH